MRPTKVSTMGDVLDARALLSDGTALVIAGRRYSYRELSRLTDRFAAGLMALGVQRGDHVGILMHNCAEFVMALIGSAKAGAVSVPINGRFKTSEAEYIFRHADLRVLLTGSDPRGVDYPRLASEVLGAGLEKAPDVAPGLAAAVSFTSDLPGFLTEGDFWAQADLVDQSEVDRRKAGVRVRDIALLMHTSGTTSHPKGCLITHEALTRHGENVAVTRFSLTADDAVWDPLPLFHCGGIVPMLGAWSQGAKYCHPGHFDATEALHTIEDEGCTVLYPAFEAIWLPIIEHPEFDSFDLSRVRIVQNIATPERMLQFEAKMPWAAQVTSYGATECSSNLTLSLPGDPLEVRANTLGKVLDGIEVKIVDPGTGTEVDIGEFGELCYRGYPVFEGYYNDEDLTERAFDADGYFHSGDRAGLRADGNLVYGGRLKDMIKVGGENVAAIEIEDYLSTHPAVRIAQVVGVRDERYVEVPAAFIELAADAHAEEDDLISYCVDRIARYKVPRYVRFVSEWPMSGTKVKKFELRDALENELDALGISSAPAPRSDGAPRAKATS